MTTRPSTNSQRGLTLVELVFSVAITALLVAGLAGIVNQALLARSQAGQQTQLLGEAQFAMERMLTAVRGTQLLMLPLADKPATTWRENVREQFVPAQAPEAGSIKATAVLAVALDHSIDSNNDGWSDANSDQDYEDLDNSGSRDPGEPERIDEDWGEDVSNDGKRGIVGIDDNGSGYVDYFGLTAQKDDDEDLADNEDAMDGVDNDGDGSVDEDPSGDMNGDGLGGIATESCILLICTPIPGDPNDDDADGLADEDGPNPVVFYINNGNQLIERRPSLVSVAFPSGVDGNDYIESAIADGVTWFRVERIPLSGGGTQLLEISLELSNGVHAVRLATQVRIRSNE